LGFNSIDRFVFINKIEAIGNKIHDNFIDVIYDSVFDEELKNLLSHLETSWFDNFRPSIIWYSSKIVGGNPNKIISPTIIMLITSLGFGIHDDIIDNTKRKHNIDTIYGLVGPKKALIVGDLLISKAISIMGKLQYEFENEICNSLVNIFSEYFSKMSTGEIWEINSNKNLNITMERYHNMLRNLGIDSEICVKIGAVCGKASKEELEALSFFGNSMGYVYRLIEEINDMLNINKLKMRIKYESIPLALLYSSNQSGSKYNKISKILKKKEIKDIDVRYLRSIFEEDDVISYIQQIIENERIQAFKRINMFKDSEAKTFLINCFESVTELEKNRLGPDKFR
jgi:geranylgeranyl pyrophosphate synthase